MSRWFKLPLVVVGLLLLMANQKCDPSGERPRWKAQFWAGFSEHEKIFRAQGDEEVECKDKRFDDFVCVTYDDLEKLEAEVLSRCKKWE